jgi:three-Cys-motif partner protein
MKSENIETDLLEHSKAKVKLYSDYLSIYLNILSRASGVKSIYLFDLLCGEGLYNNDEKGSPLACLDTVLRHCVANEGKCPNINIVFNDKGKSKIVPGLSKIERLKEIINGYDLPDNVHIQFHELDFEEIIPISYNKAKMATQSKSLFFIDPYGYKKIHSEQIKDILSLKSTEVLLFLPASNMYRFANTCLETNFCGSQPLYTFLVELFNSNKIRFESVDDFIKKCKNQFVKFLSSYQIFVDSFSIQRDRSKTYVLYFFTSNCLGFEKMLEAKWKLDEERGHGFRLDRQLSLFSGVDHSDYPEAIKAFIIGKDMVTNGQLYIFGLKNGYLPKHTKQVLDKFISNDRNFQIISLDGKETKGYYINYKNCGTKPDRKIGFRINKS